MLHLVINADDAGYSKIRDDGIVQCYLANGISNASLMVNGLSAENAVQVSKKEKMPLGLHMNITEGYPMAFHSKDSSFIDENGFMLGKFGLREAMKKGVVPINAIEEEMRAQIKQFYYLTGYYPYHIDGHHHSHIFPGIRDAFAKILAEYNIRVTRLPNEFGIKDVSWIEDSRKQFYNEISKQAYESIDVFAAHGIKFTDHFIGMATMGADMTIERLQGALQSMKQSKNKNNSNNRNVNIPRTGASYSDLGENQDQIVSCELMVHPGFKGPMENAGCGCGPDDFSLSQNRKHEMDILTSEKMQKFYTENCIKLCSFKELFL